MFVFSGVRLGGRFRVAVECCGESGALHIIRDAYGSSECSDQQDSVAQTVCDERC